jgi:hypothetical protein
MGFLGGLHITIVVIVFRRGRLLLGAACLSVLMGNSNLQLVDGSLFEFLPHDFLLTEPVILGLAMLIHVLSIGRSQG